MPTLHKMVTSRVFKGIIMLLLILASFMGGLVIGNKYLPNKRLTTEEEKAAQLAQQRQESKLEVLPEGGFQTKIVLGDAMVKLVENGVVDLEKFEQLYANRGGLTAEQRAFFTAPSNEPLTINSENAQFMVNILWPIGIANQNTTLAESEAGKPENVFGLASTGGWTLGKEDNGGYYYNKFKIIELTPEQDALVDRVAHNIFRPCCGNSTAFPDCNHGAAILGLLQLGASQGLSEDELYEESLKLNSFWFPDQYVKMALLFKMQQNKSWADLDPKLLLSEDYSGAFGFRENVAYPLSQIPGLMPQQQGGGGCSV